MKKLKLKPLERTLKEIEYRIEALSLEWDRLDSQGTGTEEQQRIANVIAKLESTKRFIKGVLENRD